MVRPLSVSRWRFGWLGLLGPLSLVLAAAPRPSGAQSEATPPGLAPLIGRYVNVATDDGRAHIAARTEEVIADVRPALRGIGRRKILANNPPLHTLTIGFQGGEVVVDYEGHRRYHAPLGGAAVENRSPDGGSVDVSYRLCHGALVEDMRARRGRAVSEYRLCPARGELELTTRVISGMLPRDIVYELVMRGPRR